VRRQQSVRSFIPAALKIDEVIVLLVYVSGKICGRARVPCGDVKIDGQILLEKRIQLKGPSIFARLSVQTLIEYAHAVAPLGTPAEETPINFIEVPPIGYYVHRRLPQTCVDERSQCKLEPTDAVNHNS